MTRELAGRGRAGPSLRARLQEFIIFPPHLSAARRSDRARAMKTERWLQPFHFTRLPPAKRFRGFVIVCFEFAAWPPHPFKIVLGKKKDFFFSYCEIDLKEGRAELHFQPPDNRLASVLSELLLEKALFAVTELVLILSPQMWMGHVSWWSCWVSALTPSYPSPCATFPARALTGGSINNP